MFQLTHIVRNGLILPLSDDVVLHVFLDIITHCDPVSNDFAAFASGALADNDA